MIGTTLAEIRGRIEGLASDDGEYYVVCGRTGDRPVPTGGLRFETRAAAGAAARATEQYRATLRRYDPRLPHYDVIVCQEGRGTVVGAEQTGPTTLGGVGWPDDDSADTDARFGVDQAFEPGTGDRSRRVEYCHRVAAALFETLSSADHDDVQSAIMDAYFELAESVPDPDDLCLCLLESLAVEIDRGLAPAQQARTVETAVSRLPDAESSDHPVAATLASLERRGLVGSYSWSPSTGPTGGRGVVVGLSDYALSPREGSLPVLPVVVELVRHEPEGRLASLDVGDAGDGWRIRLEFARREVTDGLASAQVRSEV